MIKISVGDRVREMLTRGPAPEVVAADAKPEAGEALAPPLNPIGTAGIIWRKSDPHTEPKDKK